MHPGTETLKLYQLHHRHAIRQTRVTLIFKNSLQPGCQFMLIYLLIPKRFVVRRIPGYIVESRQSHRLTTSNNSRILHLFHQSTADSSPAVRGGNNQLAQMHRRLHDVSQRESRHLLIRFRDPEQPPGTTALQLRHWNGFTTFRQAPRRKHHISSPFNRIEQRYI